VTLPFVMLLLDWWPLKRLGEPQTGGANLKRLGLEKLPFFLLAAVSCVLTVLAQRSEAVVALENHSLGLRVQNAIVSCAGYLLQTIWPTHLAILYPLPTEIALIHVIAAAFVLALITYGVWRWRKPKPHLSVGWLWFVGTLVPVIGIVQVGGQAMADRYTYLPHIGLLVAVIFELSAWAVVRAPRTKAMAVLAGAVAVVFLALTTRQLSYWKDSETLFTHTLNVTKNNVVAHINLGVALENQGRIAEARKQYEAAARLDPNRVQVQNNLANVLDLSGETEAAIEHYRMALQLKPNAPLAHLNLGSALVKLGRFDEAKLHYQEGERLLPSDPRPLYLLGKMLLRQGRSQEAVSQFKAALRLDQNHLQTIVWLARVRAADDDGQARNGDEAVLLAKNAATLTGERDPFVLDTLAAAYAETGRFDEARQTIEHAVQLLASVGDTNTATLAARQQLYQLRQPYRESFTNAVEANPVQR